MSPDGRSMYYLLDPSGKHLYQEGLGLCFAALSGVLDQDSLKTVVGAAHRTPSGLPCLWPPYERYTSLGPGILGGHSGTIWPQVNAFWVDICAHNGFRAEAAQEMAWLAERVVRDGHFAEMYHPETGERYHPTQEATSVQGMKVWRSQPRQSWSATGYVRMVLATCFDWTHTQDGLQLSPWLPDGTNYVHLEGLSYQGSALSLSLDRSADGTVALTCNGFTAPHADLPGISWPV